MQLFALTCYSWLQTTQIVPFSGTNAFNIKLIAILNQLENWIVFSLITLAFR